MTYEELLIEADGRGYVVKEKPLRMNNGRIKGRRIAIRKDLPTERQKAETLLEELEHGYSTCGNILDQNVPLNRLQELRARRRAYKRLVTFPALIKAYDAGCQSLYELSEALDVSEGFLMGALKMYAGKYGNKPVYHDNHLISFYPNLRIVRLLNIAQLSMDVKETTEKVPKESVEPSREYVVVRRLSEEELQKKIEKYRKRHLEIKRQLEKLEKKYRERDSFLLSRGIDPFQYSFDLAERARMNAEE